MILPRIQEETHRTVAVNEISLSVFPNIGVSIEGLKIANPPRGKFEHTYMLELDHLLVAVKLLPLISGRVEIKQILIDHP